jgi:serine/threonine protein kinase
VNGHRARVVPRSLARRDIKPENVLFTEHRVLKLADFGLAIDLTEERAVTRAGVRPACSQRICYALLPLKLKARA